MSERIERFGHTPELQDILAALVVAGKKRATTSLRRWYGDGGLPIPKVGEVWYVSDGEGHLLCKCRTTRVEIVPFGAVDAEHAAVEGEDNGSLDRWQVIHRQFFDREAAESGFIFDDESPVLLERFEVIEVTA
jgi:uncharacterized protein YhfF